MEWYLMAFRRYAQFDGRSRRKEYWMFVLINIVVSIVLGFVDGLIGTQVGGFGFLLGLYTLAVLVPSIAVGARRLHDTGRSGWWLLIALVPLGGLVLLYFFVLDGEAGDNRYGPNPKGAGGSYAYA